MNRGASQSQIPHIRCCLTPEHRDPDGHHMVLCSKYVGIGPSPMQQNCTISHLEGRKYIGIAENRQSYPIKRSDDRSSTGGLETIKGPSRKSYMN